MRWPDKEPHAVELWILKWIFAPIVIFILLIILLSSSASVKKCHDLCETKGYSDANYIPSGKTFQGDKCICKEALDGSENIFLPLR